MVDFEKDIVGYLGNGLVWKLEHCNIYCWSYMLTATTRCEAGNMPWSSGEAAIMCSVECYTSSG